MAKTKATKEPGIQIIEARQQGRIKNIYYDANVPVHTAWDLGYNDSTAIWQYQVCGQEIHLLEYYENSGEPLTHYLQIVKNKSYVYGKHIVLYDAAVHEYSTGLSRVEIARNYGTSFTIAPNIALIEGIDAVRNILNGCLFDETKCSLGINFASHGADAFRMLAVIQNQMKNRGLTAEEWKHLRNSQLSGLYIK